MVSDGDYNSYYHLHYEYNTCLLAPSPHRSPPHQRRPTSCGTLVACCICSSIYRLTNTFSMSVLRFVACDNGCDYARLVYGGARASCSEGYFYKGEYAQSLHSRLRRPGWTPNAWCLDPSRGVPLFGQRRLKQTRLDFRLRRGEAAAWPLRRFRSHAHAGEVRLVAGGYGLGMR